MEVLRIYGAEDFGKVIGALNRSGYRCLTWAELEQNSNNIIYLIQLNPSFNTVENNIPQNRQILNEDITDENRNQE